MPDVLQNTSTKPTAVPSSSCEDDCADKAAKAAPGNRCALWRTSAWTGTCRGQSSQLQPGHEAAAVGGKHFSEQGSKTCWCLDLLHIKRRKKCVGAEPEEYCYGRTLIAVSNEPAKMWSTGSWELLHHIWVGLIPLVGGTKNPSSAPPPAPIGTSC